MTEGGRRSDKRKIACQLMAISLLLQTACGGRAELWNASSNEASSAVGGRAVSGGTNGGTVAGVGGTTAALPSSALGGDSNVGGGVAQGGTLGSSTYSSTAAQNGGAGTGGSAVALGGTAGSAGATTHVGTGPLGGAGGGSGGALATGGGSDPQGGTTGNGGVPAIGGCCGSQGAAGNGGGTITGGTAGDSGTNCTVAACDDGEPCTADLCTDTGCNHQPLQDGVTCDDHNPCTDNDQCLAGVCQGAPRSSQAEVLSTVPTFGAYRSDEGPPLQGFAAVLPNDRLLFADRLATGNAGTSLVLTELDGGQLNVLDTYTSKLMVAGEPGGGLDWTFRLLGHLVPLSQGRVALVVANQGIEILDTSGGKLALVASFPLSSTDPIYGAVGRDNRFWTCYPGLESYSLQDDGTLNASPLGGFPLGTCKALAISPDGQELFVSGNQSLTSLNVAGDNAIVEHTNTSTGPFGSLATGAGYVVGIQLFAATGIGDVQVFNASDLSLITTLPRQSSDIPRAVAISGNDLFVQWNRGDGGWCTIAIDRYALQPSGPVRDLSFTLRDVYCAAEEASKIDWHLVPLWAQGSYTIVDPGLDVLQWQTNSVNALTGPRHGAIEKLWAISGTELDAVGLDSVHRINLADPRQPRFALGGRVLSRETNPLRFAVAEHGEFESRLVNVQTTGVVMQDATSVHISRLSGGLAAPPVNAGTLLLDGGPAYLISSGGSLFQVATVGTADFRVRRFGASSGLRAQGDVTLSADHDDEVSLNGSPEFSSRLAPLMAADDRSGDLVIAELRMDPSNAQNTQQLLLWLSYDQNSSKFQSVASGTLSSRVDDVALWQGRRLLVAGPTVQVLKLDQGQFQVHAQLTIDSRSEVRRILQWDGERTYLSVLEPNGDGFAPAVWVLNGDDLTEIARYELPDEALAMDSVGPNLVFGMKTGISVAAPACQ